MEQLSKDQGLKEINFYQGMCPAMYSSLGLLWDGQLARQDCA